MPVYSLEAKPLLEKLVAIGEKEAKVLPQLLQFTHRGESKPQVADILDDIYLERSAIMEQLRAYRLDK